MSRMTRAEFLKICAGTWLMAGVWNGATRLLSAANPPRFHAQRAIQHLAEMPHDRAPVVTGIALSPDALTLATAGDDHLVRLWNLSDGKLLHLLKEHNDWVRSTAFTPDGQLLATAGDDRQVRLWKVTSGALVKTLPEHPLAIRCVRFSPDGNTLGTAGFDRQVRIYQTRDGAPQREFAATCPDMRAVAFSRDGTLLAAGGRDGRLRLWNLAMSADGPLVSAHTRRLRAIAFSPDDAALATAGDDQTVQIWTARDAQLQAAIPIRGCKVMALAWCGPGVIAAGGSDNLIHLFDVGSRQELATLAGHTGTIAALDADATGRTLVSGSFDTTARVWNLETALTGATTARAAPPLPPRGGVISPPLDAGARNAIPANQPEPRQPRDARGNSPAVQSPYQ